MDAALTQLCSGLKIYLGLFVMLCILIGIILHLVNFFIYDKKPKEAKKSWLGTARNILLCLAALSIIVYILAPPILSMLFGKDIFLSGCASSPQTPPYCGQDYCNKKPGSVPFSSNCTCLEYAMTSS